MNEQALERAAAIGLPRVNKLPRYICKNKHGSTYKVQIRNKYVGTFPTVEAAQACIDEIFAETKKPTQCASELA